MLQPQPRSTSRVADGRVQAGGDGKPIVPDAQDGAGVTKVLHDSIANGDELVKAVQRGELQRTERYLT